MNVRELVSNFSVAALAQGIAMLLSVIISLLVPKVLGVVEFGYWQLFIFYAGYVAVFHLGLDDGVYLIYGGVGRSAIDKRRINSSLAVGMTYQSAEALVLACIAVMGPFESERRFVVLAVCVFILLNNFNSYCSHVFQAMDETKLASASIMVDRLVFLVPLLAFLLLGVPQFEPYVLAYGCSKLAACLFCAWKMCEFIRSGVLPFREARSEAWTCIRVGAKLLAANMASMLILGIARYAIDLEWGIEAFGQFSLALAMENFFITFVSQLAMVLFPALRKANADERARAFDALRKGLSLLLPVVYLLYFPLRMFVGWWLPAYESALYYLGLVLPICVFESRMSLIGGTYFKVMRGEGTLLAVNVVSVLASTLGVMVGVWVVGSIEFMMLWVVAVLAMRSLYSEGWGARAVGAGRDWGWATCAAFTLAFELAISFLPMEGAFAGIGAAYIAYVLANHRTLRSLAGSVRPRRKQKPGVIA